MWVGSWVWRRVNESSMRCLCESSAQRVVFYARRDRIARPRGRKAFESEGSPRWIKRYDRESYGAGCNAAAAPHARAAYLVLLQQQRARTEVSADCNASEIREL